MSGTSRVICEVLFGSTSKDDVTAWNAKTGSVLMNYKGGAASPKTLNLYDGKWLLSVQDSKPLLNLWAIHQKEKMHFHSVCPGLVTCMAIAAQYNIGIMAVNEAVEFLKIGADGTIFVSAGRDGLMMVWNLVDLTTAANAKPGGRHEPVHLWSQHSLPVTGLHVTLGANQARLFDIMSGRQLISLQLSCDPSSVTMDNAEFFIFVGAVDGSIFKISLLSETKSAISEAECSSSSAKKQDHFAGHKACVNYLQVSMDGLNLFSGSQDGTIRIWHISSGQCLRTFPLKDPVTNMFVSYLPIRIFNEPEVKKQIPFKRFQMHDENMPIKDVDVHLKWPINRQHNQSVLCIPNLKEPNEPLEELQKIKHINKELYTYIVNHILSAK